MNYSMIAAPLIGAVIGYATNYIAIKMMFRPRKAVKIGNFTLPFTPGIIPKGQPRLARAIGKVVSTNLLSKDILKETLLSDDMKAKVAAGFHDSIVKMQDDERTIHEVITRYVDKDDFDASKSNAIDYAAQRINQQLQSHPVGAFVASEVIRNVKEHTKGGILSLMVNDSFLLPIGEKIQQGIDAYLKENTISLVTPVLTEECDKLLDKPMTDTAELLASHEDALTNAILKGYEQLIENRLESVFHSIDISSIVESRINAMDVIELEELVLSVMKKELNAIVNLGAVIGFILGLINLFFQ